MNFQSKDVKGNWIKFDFGNNRVNLTDYLIKSRLCNEDSSHPKSWVIEGSNDDSVWEIIDVQKDCPYLNGYGVSHAFTLENPNPHQFKYIRMRLTGKDWQGANILMINAFEMFGQLN